MPDHDRWPPSGGDPSLNDINRIDRFIDALATNQTAYSTDREEADLAFLLADWRDGVRDAPLAAVVTSQDAVAALRSSKATSRRTRSLTLVGSVAAAVLCLGGFGTAVYGANPGDSLYGVRSMLFGQQQKTRDDQVSLASAQLAQVQQLVDQGQWKAAQDKLVALSPTVQSVGAPEDQHDLTEQYNALTYKVIQQDPAATLPPPGAPPPVLPPLSALTLLPVPVVVESTTSTPTTTSTESTVTSGQESSPATTSSTSTSSSSPSSSSTSASSESPTSQADSVTTTTAPSTSTSAPPTSASAPSSSSASSTTTAVTTTTTTIVRDAPAPISSPQAAASPAVPPSPVTPSVAVAPSVAASPSVVTPSAPAVQSSVIEPTQPARPTAHSPQRDVPQEAPTTTTLPRSAGAVG